MNAPVKITGTVKAWTTSNWRKIDEISYMISEGKIDDAIAGMTYVNHDMSNTEEWAEVGIAEITVTFHPREDIVTKELEGLNKQLEKVRADNQWRENVILDRISKLQALEYTA